MLLGKKKKTSNVLTHVWLVSFHLPHFHDMGLRSFFFFDQIVYGRLKLETLKLNFFLFYIRVSLLKSTTIKDMIIRV